MFDYEPKSGTLWKNGVNHHVVLHKMALYYYQDDVLQGAIALYGARVNEDVGQNGDDTYFSIGLPHATSLIKLKASSKTNQQYWITALSEQIEKLRVQDQEHARNAELLKETQARLETAKQQLEQLKIQLEKYKQKENVTNKSAFRKPSPSPSNTPSSIFRCPQCSAEFSSINLESSTDTTHLTDDSGTSTSLQEEIEPTLMSPSHGQSASKSIELDILQWLLKEAKHKQSVLSKELAEERSRRSRADQRLTELEKYMQQGRKLELVSYVGALPSSNHGSSRSSTPTTVRTMFRSKSASCQYNNPTQNNGNRSAPTTPTTSRSGTPSATSPRSWDDGPVVIPKRSPSNPIRPLKPTSFSGPLKPYRPGLSNSNIAGSKFPSPLRSGRTLDRDRRLNVQTQANNSSRHSRQNPDTISSRFWSPRLRSRTPGNNGCTNVNTEIFL